MNRYLGVYFRKKTNTEDNEQEFIVSQDLIKRGVIIDNLYIKKDEGFCKLTNKMTILNWIRESKDKKLYEFINDEYVELELNDISFDDYIRLFNENADDIGNLIIERYSTHNGERCAIYLSLKDEIDNAVYCEYYNKTTQSYIYTKRIMGLDKVINDEEIKNHFEKIKEENHYM